MLNHLFKPPVSRSEYDRAMKSYEITLALAIEQRNKAIAERDAVFDEHTLAVNRELKATALLHRACILLKEVDPSRTGGKQLRDAREKLFADAMLAGLWGELPIKE